MKQAKLVRTRQPRRAKGEGTHDGLSAGSCCPHSAPAGGEKSEQGLKATSLPQLRHRFVTKQADVQPISPSLSNKPQPQAERSQSQDLAWKHCLLLDVKLEAKSRLF